MKLWTYGLAILIAISASAASLTLIPGPEKTVKDYSANGMISWTNDTEHDLWLCEYSATHNAASATAASNQPIVLFSVRVDSDLVRSAATNANRNGSDFVFSEPVFVRKSAVLVIARTNQYTPATSDVFRLRFGKSPDIRNVR